MPRLMILLALPEAVRQQYKAAIEAKFPDLQIEAADHWTKALPAIGSVDILLTFAPMLRDEAIRSAVNLKWVQALGTGVDNLVDLPSMRKDILVTNMQGIHGPPVSEAALAAMLAVSRDLPRAVRNQSAALWERWPARLLHGKTVGIFGVGAIATTLAPMCKAFGMRVIGISSSVRAVPGFDAMRPRDPLTAAVSDLDYLVLLTPLTPATRGIVDRTVLQAMKPTSFLINLARGGVVDETALIESLDRGAIAGAALDVFAEEPLPQSHPFWTMKNVVVTTHQGGFCDIYPDLAMPIVEANLRRFLAGDRANMVNVVRR